MRVAIVIAVLSLLMPVQAIAFSVEGVSSGDSVDQVGKELRSRGFQSFKHTGSGELYFAKRGEASHFVEFCNAKLFSFAYSLEGGVGQFIRTASGIAEKYGAGLVSASAVEKTSVGELLSLGGTWATEQDFIELTYFPSTQKTGESVSLKYKAKGRCAAKQ